MSTLGDPEPWEEPDDLLPPPEELDGLPDDQGLDDGEPDEEPASQDEAP